jgi:HEAT repeat protein
VTVKPEAIEAVGRLVRQGTWPEVKANAARAVGILRGRAAVPQLLDGLKGRDTQLILESLNALQKIRDRDTAAAIGPHLNDLNERVQVTAIELAGLLQDKVSLPPLRRALSGAKTSRVRASALMAIAMIPDEENRPLFDANLGDKDDDVRAAAAEGYGRLRNKADIPKLEKGFAEETHMKPRLGYAFSLVALGKAELSEFGPLQYLVNTLNSSAYSGLAAPFLVELSRNKTIRESLYPGMEGRTAREKVELADIIAKTGDKSSLPVLERLAADSEPKVAQAGQRAVALLKSRV